MSVKEIEAAISQLAPGDLAELTSWFDEYQSRKWDERIERDARTGRFDALIEQAREHYRAGRTRPV